MHLKVWIHLLELKKIIPTQLACTKISVNLNLIIYINFSCYNLLKIRDIESTNFQPMHASNTTYLTYHQCTQYTRAWSMRD